MPDLDVFKADAFSMQSLTVSMNKLPYKPARLGELGIFKKSGITTTVATIEEQNGRLMLIPTAARGSIPNVLGGKPRKVVAFPVPHCPLSACVYADDVQNIRAFASETEVMQVSDLVNDKLNDMRQSIEYTIEWFRLCAIKGILVDVDAANTQLYSWFTEFNQTQATSALNWAQANSVKLMASTITRSIQDALGMTPYTEIRVMCGAGFYDAISIKDEVKTAYQWFQEAAFLRGQQTRKSFEFGGVTWEEYRGSYGTTPFIADNEAYAFPVGADDCFAEIYAPANFKETVNTKGLPVYAKQEDMKWGLGVELFAQSNPLVICTRPAVLYKITETGTRPTMAADSHTERTTPYLSDEDKEKEKEEKAKKEEHDKKHDKK